MSIYQIPTEPCLKEIASRVRSHPRVADVSVAVVVHVTTTASGQSAKEIYETIQAVYEIEKKIMRDNPDLLFDFRVTREND